MSTASTARITVNGELVDVPVTITEAPWIDTDDTRIRGAVVVGRARVEVDGGGGSDALVVKIRDVFQPTHYYAVFWDRSSRRFVAAEIHHPSER